MALGTWWPGDPLPDLGSLTGFKGTLELVCDKLASITGLDRGEIDARLDDGNLCYVGWLGGTAVGYGWVAGSTASIGELSMDFQLPSHDLYLWDFKTLPQWRGRGAYPRLLQHILREEGTIDRRFWIITTPETLPPPTVSRRPASELLATLRSPAMDDPVSCPPLTLMPLAP